MTRNRILIAIFLLLCGVLLFYQVSKNLSIHEVYGVFRVLDYKYLLAAWAVCISATIIRGYKWHLLAGGTSRPRPIFFVNMYIINTLTNQILPMKLGELVTPYIMNKFDNNACTYLRRLTRLLLDRIIETVFLLLLFLFSVYWLIIDASFKYGSFLVIFIITAIAAIILTIKFQPSIGALVAQQYHKVKSRIELPEFFIVKKLCLFTLLAYLGDIYCFYFVLKAAGIDIGPFKALIIFSTSITIGVLTLIPGGVGIIELITVRLLHQFGYDNQTAVLTSVYVRVVSMVFIGLFFLYLFFYGMFFKRKINASQSFP